MTQQDIRHFVAENVEQRMTELNLSVAELASKAGCGLDHVYKILREETDVGYEKLGGLARALNVEVADLFERSKRKRAS